MNKASRILWPVLLTASAAMAQDRCPLKNRHVWLPMTGVTDAQMDDAVAAGFDTIMLKIHAPFAPDGQTVDFASTDELISRATDRGFKVILAILGWAGLGQGQFWDTDEAGNKIPNRLDPFWPEAMARVEQYHAQIIDHYKADPHVVAFAPTWGIYGEAGFTSFTAGRSRHALDRFNEWRTAQNLPPVNAIPTRQAGPNTDYNHFIRFRYLYLEQQFDGMIRRLKRHSNGSPVGTWQELYPVIGYLYNMVHVPAADFALYESCFPFQTTHDPARTLAETMGFRYRCRSAGDYRDYYLPLLARKRGDGQRFMGCQLSNDYAVKNYGWSREQTARVGFDRWEDEFSPHLKRLLDQPLESPPRDVLLVFPSYAAAALSDRVAHSVDTMFIDILLRMFGCQMTRMGSPAFDKLTVADLDRYRLIVVPCSSYLLADTLARLKRTSATVLFTGCFAQSLDGKFVPFGQTRSADRSTVMHYHHRPVGLMTVHTDHALTRNLIRDETISLPQDESFRFDPPTASLEVLARCGPDQLLTTRAKGHFIFIHGHLFAGLAHDPDRKPPANLGGSADPSANEHDPWGPHSSNNPQNAVGRRLIKNILDFANVDYRVPDPKPRTNTPYLGDHMEPASINANIAYNNTATPQTLTVRLPYPPKNHPSRAVNNRFETTLTIPPFSYIAIESQDGFTKSPANGSR